MIRNIEKQYRPKNRLRLKELTTLCFILFLMRRKLYLLRRKLQILKAKLPTVKTADNTKQNSVTPKIQKKLHQRCGRRRL